jgi:cytochrome c
MLINLFQLSWRRALAQNDNAPLQNRTRETVVKALSLISLCLMLASGSVTAGEQLVKKNNCIGCHHMTDKKVGPTWKAMAEKNKGVADAEKILAEGTVKGSKGKYGKVAMPPQPKAKADADKIAKWILTL